MFLAQFRGELYEKQTQKMIIIRKNGQKTTFLGVARECNGAKNSESSKSMSRHIPNFNSLAQFGGEMGRNSSFQD